MNGAVTAISDRSIESVADNPEELTQWFKNRLRTQYELNRVYLDNLGLGDSPEIPSFAEVESAVSSSTLQWLGERAVSGNKDRLVIAPSAQHIGLRGTDDEPGLITRFNAIQPRRGRIRLGQYWQSTGDRLAVHDNYYIEPFPAAILLDSSAKTPSPNEINGGRTTHQQTYSYNASLSDKEKTLAHERNEQASYGRDLQAITLPQFIAVEAQDRMLATPTDKLLGSTALVHYPHFSKRRAEILCVPTIFREGRRGQRLVLAERWVGIANESVRRALHLPIVRAETEDELSTARSLGSAE